MLEFSFKQNDLLDPIVQILYRQQYRALESKKSMNEGEKFVLLIHMNSWEPEKKR